MPELLRMPEVATGSTSAVLSAWQVDIDQQYSAGDVVAVLETDKAVVDMEAEADGRIVHFLADGGQEVATGDPIAIWAGIGEEVADPQAAAQALGVGDAAGTVKIEAEQSAPQTSPQVQVAEVLVSAERIFASPIARRLAREAGLALESITGTGPNGRIRRRDVEAARASAPAGAPTAPVAPAVPTVAPSTSASGYREIPHTRLRRAIASRLTESKTTVPHFYLRGVAEVDALLDLRRQMNEGEDLRVSVNDFIVKAVAYAHAMVPEMNVIWTPDAMRQFDSVDISVAIATETGLVTPVVRGVTNLSLGQIAETTKDFAQRAKSGALKQSELEGGSISVSNLGMFGTQGFDAIINPPQSSILAVGAARETPVARDGAIAVGTTVEVSLSVDHRPIDGATAARWMQVFVNALENPAKMLR
jgi:pyruvate dehydrogenase E2 component (dihydrolipoamide acetyltransferase)